MKNNNYETLAEIHLNFKSFKHLHFIGIGGIGMSSLAEILFKLGYTVSGSDLKTSVITKRLASQGVTIFQGHSQNHIKDSVDLVVITSALRDNNIELIRAKSKKIPVITRGQLLAEIMSDRYGIAISGTHGKTTTTAILTNLFEDAHLSPSYAIGGYLKKQNCSAMLGESDFFIAESDESDLSFLALNPKEAVITNIDYDHMSAYSGDYRQVDQSFIDFSKKIASDGYLILNIDCEKIKSLIKEFAPRRRTLIGLSNQADIQATNIRYHGLQSQFTLIDHRINQSFDITLNLPGEYNIYNALSAIAVARNHQIDYQVIQRSLATFSGVGRRFETFNMKYKRGEFTLINDYGHHPSEIKATLKTIREHYPKRRIVHLFQPHRYSRTSEHFEHFVDALAKSDLSILLKTYAASELPSEGLGAETLVEALTQKGKNCDYADSHKQAEEKLKSLIKPDDVVLIQGAGDVNQLTSRLNCW
ncbi:UDP-N-acetylmuramate--L-alanine ligase [Thiotrichales bacterium 19S11-10]|nr:UDP-N-acetylmuramate--L-alanine ligase [Thiotrichales bacterium 19S11-10]MCF6806875.1 UDP-N-acetylmuramate--L-alanine ligase [Thiotrichales bacterium 19S9-11]MCF6810844.1 UDP-N-acetylmuramate--L-alanine ligase [Thiotrichales bacterium 19S9-12]